MIYSSTLKKSLYDQKGLFQELYSNKNEIYRLKCSEIRKSDTIDIRYSSLNGAQKDFYDRNEGLKIGDTISQVISTMHYMDSHDDVHAIGMFSKSAQEQQGRIYHAIDHSLSVTTLVAYPRDVSMELKRVNWSELGKNYPGETEILLFNSKITDKTNPDIFKAYRDNEPIQGSVRMQYVALELAINDPDYKEEKVIWDKYRQYIANGEAADKLGYFFWIKEAKIYKEGSSVLFGSNDATPYFYTPTTLITEPDEQATLEHKSESKGITYEEMQEVVSKYL